MKRIRRLLRTQRTLVAFAVGFVAVLAVVLFSCCAPLCPLPPILPPFDQMLPEPTPPAPPPATPPSEPPAQPPRVDAFPAAPAVPGR